VKRAVADLHHDVGKRIARTARNVQEAPLPLPILALLLKDLYAIDGTTRASEVFRARRVPLAKLDLADVADALERIDALEAAVRRNDADAVHEALSLAVFVSDRISALLAREANR
jgi:hypothetical protein